METRLPDLVPSSAASSPLAPLDTPSTFENGFSGLQELPEESAEGIEQEEARIAAKQQSAPVNTAPTFAGRRGSATHDMATLLASHPSRNRRGSDETREGDEIPARRSSLAPRPSIAPLHADYGFNGARRQSAGLQQAHYPGQPAPIHLQPPTSEIIAPSFRFGSLNLNEDFSFAPGSSGHAPYVGTPAAELGPFEYPSADGGSGRNSPARPGINPLGDGHASAAPGSFGSVDADLAGLRSVTTGQIPVLPSIRRPSVVHSATVADVPRQDSICEDPERRGSGAAAKLADLSKRRPSVLLSRLLPPEVGPVPPSLLNARRGSLPAATLFAKAGGIPPRAPADPADDRPPGARGSALSSTAIPGSAISAAYLYNRRSSLATPAYLANSSIASPVRPIGTLPMSLVGDVSPAPSSRGSFSSHSTVTAQESETGTPMGLGSRRQSLPFIDVNQPTPALEALRQSKVAADDASDDRLSPIGTRPLNMLNLSAHGSKNSSTPPQSALSTASGSSSGHEGDEPELSQVARVAAAIRERRRSSKNSLLSRGSLASIPADEAVLYFTGPNSHRGSTDSAGPRSQASVSSDDSAPSVSSQPPATDATAAFDAFSFPAHSPLRRTAPVRPGLETIPSDEQDVKTADADRS